MFQQPDDTRTLSQHIKIYTRQTGAFPISLPAPPLSRSITFRTSNIPTGVVLCISIKTPRYTRLFKSILRDWWWGAINALVCAGHIWLTLPLQERGRRLILDKLFWVLQEPSLSAFFVPFNHLPTQVRGSLRSLVRSLRTLSAFFFINLPHTNLSLDPGSMHSAPILPPTVVSQFVKKVGWNES
jgi:hypothetical protein